MPQTEHLLPCPFCQGQGKMLRSQIVERLEDPELPEKIIAELIRSEQGAEKEPVLAGESTEKGSQPGEHARNVHSWNKHVLWRRSSKE